MTARMVAPQADTPEPSHSPTHLPVVHSADGFIHAGEIYAHKTDRHSRAQAWLVATRAGSDCRRRRRGPQVRQERGQGRCINRAKRTARRDRTTPPRGPRSAPSDRTVVLQPAWAGVGGPSRRSSSRGSAGQASSRTGRGTLRAAYRKARATTTTSSSGPMTGRNSGIRSIGESTHRPANATATLARRGTRGSRANRRAVVAQAGSTVARSFAAPGGSRRASTINSAHEAMMTPTAITRSQITPLTIAVRPELL